LLSREDERWLWYKKLGYLNLKIYFKNFKENLGGGSLNLYRKTHLLYKAYQKVKQLKNSFKPKIMEIHLYDYR